MDDSASALDFKTDAALRHAIRERGVRGAAEGGLPLTTVIVSQRVPTVRDADMICVLDHGSVAGLVRMTSSTQAASSIARFASRSCAARSSRAVRGVRRPRPPQPSPHPSAQRRAAR